MNKIYKSTRGQNEYLSSKEAILKGMPSDGGLFVYDDIDKIKIDLNKVISNSYFENALYILKNLLPDYSETDLKYAVDKAYKSFDTKEITPIKKVGNSFVLELFHGPTSAFKDVALTLLPNLMSIALKEKNKKEIILTATSGDTGKAALSGFKDIDGIDIVVFYPHNKVSKIQYMQMASQKGKNVHVYSVNGNFDDAQKFVKKAFLDKELLDLAEKNNILLSSANSINIGRLIPQIVYYFESYKKLVKMNEISLGDEVVFSVPTGNFGDVLAGYYAYLMGLPVKRFIVATNENKVLTDFINTGIYDKNREFKETISPSMDILVSSNLERLLYYMLGKDESLISKLMTDLNEKGRFEVSNSLLKNIQSLFSSYTVSEEETKKEIFDVFKKHNYLLDTHTAISYKASMYNKEGKAIILSTASPYKFSKVVLESISEKIDDEFMAMERLEEVSGMRIPKNLANLKNEEIIHKNIIEKEDIINVVKSIINDKN